MVVTNGTTTNYFTDIVTMRKQHLICKRCGAPCRELPRRKEAYVTLFEEPYDMKVCAVVRTKGITTKGGRSLEQMTPRWTTNLNPKGGGDKSMYVKRGVLEDVYDMVLQHLSDKAKARLPES